MESDPRCWTEVSHPRVTFEMLDKLLFGRQEERKRKYWRSKSYKCSFEDIYISNVLLRICRRAAVSHQDKHDKTSISSSHSSIWGVLKDLFHLRSALNNHWQRGTCRAILLLGHELIRNFWFELHMSLLSNVM